MIFWLYTEQDKEICLKQMVDKAEINHWIEKVKWTLYREFRTKIGIKHAKENLAL